LWCEGGCSQGFDTNEVAKASKIDLSILLGDGSNSVDLLSLHIIEGPDNISIGINLGKDSKKERKRGKEGRKNQGKESGGNSENEKKGKKGGKRRKNSTSKTAPIWFSVAMRREEKSRAIKDFRLGYLATKARGQLSRTGMAIQ
jgi:hypothetical protein